MKLRSIPSVNSLLETLPWGEIKLPRGYVADIVRRELAIVRKQAKNGREIPEANDIAGRVRKAVMEACKPSLSQVINGTGIVLHTGLGRAPYPAKMLKTLSERMEGYSSLELDLATGKRGDRMEHVAPLLRSLTGAEAALVVNNNAAAVLLALNSLAEGKGVLISRGQLVEIGGSFRMPEVILKSGAMLVEIGTTNRTHFRDYEEAIDEKTGAILVVHSSNYRVTGFTKEVSVRELSELSRKKNVPLIMDLGSGALFDLGEVDLPYEPVASDMLKQGADLVTFSGDKLLGGPQAGLICGSTKLMRRLHRNPLYRALRCDKMTLALLELTLRSYGEKAPTLENLTYQLMAAPRTTLVQRGRDLISSLKKETVKKLGLSLVDSEVEAGSGSLPTESIESIALKFATPTLKPSELARRFRGMKTPTLGYISGGRFFIDLKAILPAQYGMLCEAIEEIAERC